jgi:hypothetical protein
VRLTTTEGSRVLIDVLRSLEEDDLAPATLAVREPSMDDVFIALAGHRAQSDGAAAADASADGDRPAGRRGRRGGAP